MDGIRLKGFKELLQADRILEEAKAKPQSSDQDFITIPLANLVPGKFQPRRDFNQSELNDLASSIKEHGILQPLIVRQLGDHYEIIAGERRWRAAKIAGINSVPALIRNIDDSTTLAVALIENIQRQDLNVLEEAKALHRLLTEFSLTHEAIAKKVGRSRAAVTNILRLLSLSESAQEHLAKGKIDMGHARAIISLSIQEQEEVIETIVEKNLSVRETERLIKAIKNPPKKQAVQYIQQEDKELLDNFKNILSDKLYSVVDIQFDSKSNKGKFIVHFDGIDELHAIITNAWPES